jgi:predicted dehydrogenase
MQTERTPVRAVLIGAGNRGLDVFGAFALAHPERLRVVAVAEPREERRRIFAERHALGPEACFPDWKEALDVRAPARDAAIVATDDMGHVEPAIAALERGLHVLLEKPIAPTLPECVRVVRAGERAGRILQIGHVLRYSRFYRTVHELLTAGRVGRVLTVDMKEHVAHWHMTHSYVRGKFRNRRVAAPIVLAKCCHDLDLLAWLVGRRALRLASFADLTHYREESAPPGAPARCTDGCPAQKDCPHDAERFYLGPDEKLARGWPWSDVSTDPTREARRRALETGRYGRCAFRCDNDVPDHQVVQFEFEGGVLATFTLQGHATHETRTLRVSGSLGELRGSLASGELELVRHGHLETERFDVGAPGAGHFGGDQGLLEHFTDVVARGAVDEVVTSGRTSLESHVLGFAAEASRASGRVVDLDAFRREAGA